MAHHGFQEIEMVTLLLLRAKVGKLVLLAPIFCLLVPISNDAYHS